MKKIQRKLMFNECLDIRWKTAHFCILNFSLKMILFEKKYQTFNTVFHHQMKHLEVRQKYSAARRIFNSLLGVSSRDETLHLMLDILLPLSLVTFLMLRPIWVWGKPLARMCPSFGHLLVATCEMDRVIACWNKELFSDHGKGPFFELIYKSTLIKCWTVCH